MNYLDTDADIDGEYRYDLTRRWDDELPTQQWIMLNPSTADAATDDATIRRVVRFAAAAGFGGVVVHNLYALRSRWPAEMLAHPDPIGPRNDDALLAGIARHGPEPMCGWGANATTGRQLDVWRLLRDAGARPQCLGITKHGFPKHPLYLPNSATARPFEVAASLTATDSLPPVGAAVTTSGAGAP